MALRRERIFIPSIRDDDAGYSILFRLMRQIQESPIGYFEFDFRRCSILDQNAVAVLGGLTVYVEKYNNLTNYSISRALAGRPIGIDFNVSSMSSIIARQLDENNFLPTILPGRIARPSKSDYIGYRHHMEVLDADEIANHLHNHWLADPHIGITEELKRAVVSRIFEIYNNAYGHGSDQQEKIKGGVISCAQHKNADKRQSHQLKLTVLDFGPGILRNVRNYLSAPLESTMAMQWALTAGNSTETDSREKIPRGLGFDLLREFVSKNKGEIRIYSNECAAKLDDNGKYNVQRLKTPIAGTIVSITINCDGRSYAFASQLSEMEQFY